MSRKRPLASPPGNKPASLRQSLIEHLKLMSFKIAAFIPEGPWRVLAKPVARWLVRRDFKPVRQWRLNFEVVKARPPSDDECAAAMQSWLLNTVASLSLHRWSAAKVHSRVVIANHEVRMLQQLAAERGLVLALPHMGSWDLAAIWASLNGLPVISVAENLPAGQFEYFKAMRERLGVQILRQYEPDIVGKLAAALQAGRVVALVADRDFSRKGVAVDWPTTTATIPMTLPAGPGLIAQQTGAALVPLGLHFVGQQMIVELCDVIEPAPGPEGLASMMQRQADFFAQQVCDHVIDWHMLQRFFPGVEA